MLPVEVGIPSIRITYYDHQTNKLEKPINLDLLPKIRGNALLKSVARKQRMTRQFNKMVKPRQFQVGDYVLKKVEATSKFVDRGKLGKNLDGPYMVTKIVRLGTYELRYDSGNSLPRPWSVDHLKKFYF